MAKFTGTAGTDLFIGTDAVQDIFDFTPANLASTDTIVGGLGTVSDILQITGAGSISASQLAGVSGIESIKMFANSSIELDDAFVSTSRTGLVGITGSAGNDTVFGGDILTASNKLSFAAGGGNDTFVGGAGNDKVTIASAELTNHDLFLGGGGADTLAISTSGAPSSSAFNNVFGFETIMLNDGGNAITLGQGTVGSASNGVVFVIGGNGLDQVDASNVASGRVVFNAGDGDNTFLGTGGNDSATGGNGNDFLAGNNGNDVLNGGAGNNTIQGGAGNDTINNGAGASLVQGGAGKDTITVFTIDSAIDTLFYAAPTEGGDTIKGDLSHLHGSEIGFKFDGAGFSTLGNNFDKIVFDDGTNGAAADGADLVIYNDGSGPGLGSAAAVDNYFFSRFSSSGVGAFLLDYNPDAFTGVLYYDSSASSHNVVTAIATLQGLGAQDGGGAAAAAALSNNFLFS